MKQCTVRVSYLHHITAAEACRIAALSRDRISCVFEVQHPVLASVPDTYAIVQASAHKHVLTVMHCWTLYAAALLGAACYSASRRQFAYDKTVHIATLR
eukprot:10125-Heterococcus_DN1.PRE.1